jgi:hypothetical protein
MTVVIVQAGQQGSTVTRDARFASSTMEPTHLAYHVTAHADIEPAVAKRLNVLQQQHLTEVGVAASLHANIMVSV